MHGNVNKFRRKNKSATVKLPWSQIQSAACFGFYMFSGEKIKKSFLADRLSPEVMRMGELDKGQIGIPLVHILPDNEE